MDLRWRINLLGGLRAQQGERLITRFRTEKTALLLAYLAYYSQHPHLRDTLVELLWPDIDLNAARASLRVALSSLRLQLKPDAPAGPLLVADRTTASLTPSAFSTDVAELHDCLRTAACLESARERTVLLDRAIDLYRGELLAGYHETWILTEREHLAALYLEALHQRLLGLEQMGDLKAALEVARRAVSADPLREEAHYDLMRLYAALGQPSATLRQYQELERRLREELGETPSAATRALADELRSNARTIVVARVGRRGDGPPAVPAALDLDAALKTASPLPDAPELPPQFTRFFGREEEIACISETLCDPQTRLATLTGPGGSGKTRLAISVAGRLRELFGGAVWFVPLADLPPSPLPDAGFRHREPGEGAPPLHQIARAVADALELAPQDTDHPLKPIVDALSGRPAMLVLDNMEHLGEEGAVFVRALLARAPQLTCLVTSRQSLDLSGEREFAVLPLPTPRKSDTLEQLRESASVQLFVDRARAVRPGFQVTEANAAVVGALCDRLEGLPLALELAAAWAQTLSPSQMLDHLSRPFELLVSRQRDLSARHRSLRATIEWSYQLLSPELQRFFAQLSVFRGGWTLSAAAAVCGDEPSLVAGRRPPVVEHLRHLQECSLVVAEETGSEMRFRLLEMLREYAIEQMDPRESRELRERHARYYLALAQEAQPRLAGREQREWYDRLEREYENLRAALDWCQSTEGDAELGLHLAVALGRFWLARGYLVEGLMCLEALLARPAPFSPSGRIARARAQACAGLLCIHSDKKETARLLSEESLAAGRALDDKPTIARSLHNLGVLAHRYGDNRAARAFLDEALAILRERGDRAGMAIELCHLGLVAQREGDPGVAAFYQEGLAIARELGDQGNIAGCLTGLGWMSYDEGDLGSARACLQESIAIRRELNDRLGLSTSLRVLADVRMAEGNSGAARALCEEALTICRELGNRSAVAFILGHLGTAAQLQGDREAARACLTESMAILREMGDQPGLARILYRMAYLLRADGDHAGARSLQEEALAIGQRFEDKRAIDRALADLGATAYYQGDMANARALLGQSLALRRELNDRRAVLGCLEWLARVAEAQGQAERAARLFGAADALSKALGTVPARMDAEGFTESVAAARAALGEAAFAAAWAAGKGMTWQQATADGLGEAAPMSTP